MTILFDATRSVKTTRNFGRGILPTYPTYTRTHSAADDAWLIEQHAKRDAADRRLDRMAAESMTIDRLTNGHAF